MPEPRPEFAALLAAPLLGESGQQAARRCAALRADPDLSLLEDGLLSFIMGELSRVAGQPDATAQLARAARLLGEAGALPLELRARVAVARALAGGGRKAIAERLADEVLPDLEAQHALAADHLLLQAELGRGDRRQHLETLLGLLPSPARDADRLAALRALATLHLEGGDRRGARRHLGAALDLARRHDDRVQVADLALALAALLLEAGPSPEAEALLLEAMELCQRLDDSLGTVAAASCLAALRLAREDWVGAAQAAEVELEAAERRQAWLAVADAAITLSTCLMAADEARQAVHLLVHTGSGLRARGAAGAVNLLKGRLGELRSLLGAKTFDQHLWSA